MHIVVEELITRRRCEDESVVEILNRQARREYVATIRGFVVVTDAAGLFQGFVITGVWVSLLVATLVVTASLIVLFHRPTGYFRYFVGYIRF